MGAPERTARAARPRGQHFLRSRRLAGELAEQAAVGPGTLVLEIGAGSGRLTEALAARAAEVVAVELDPALAAGLRRRYAGAAAKVRVVEADVLAIALPARPFQAVGNLPFAGANAILRRLLDDPRLPLERADLILQLEAAQKRAAPWPGSRLSLGWLPWWQLLFERRLAAACFEPRPSVDAGLLSAIRRQPPLLPAAERAAFAALLARGFAVAQRPLRRSLAGSLPPRAWKRLARERGLALDARPNELQVFDWVALHELSTSIRGRGSTRPRRAPRRASPAPGRSRPPR